MHSGLWEDLVDALFWLQLTWIFSGFLLMVYFALRVFPKEKEGTNSRSDAPSTLTQRPELITLGNYRFEIASQTTPPSNVIELYAKQTDRAGLR